MGACYTKPNAVTASCDSLTCPSTETRLSHKHSNCTALPVSPALTRKKLAMRRSSARSAPRLSSTRGAASQPSSTPAAATPARGSGSRLPRLRGPRLSNRGSTGSAATSRPSLSPATAYEPSLSPVTASKPSTSPAVSSKPSPSLAATARPSRSLAATSRPSPSSASTSRPSSSRAATARPSPSPASSVDADLVDCGSPVLRSRRPPTADTHTPSTTKNSGVRSSGLADPVVSSGDGASSVPGSAGVTSSVHDGDIRVGISTGGATIALSVNIGGGGVVGGAQHPPAVDTPASVTVTGGGRGVESHHITPSRVTLDTSGVPSSGACTAPGIDLGAISLCQIRPSFSQPFTTTPITRHSHFTSSSTEYGRSRVVTTALSTLPEPRTTEPYRRLHVGTRSHAAWGHYAGETTSPITVRRRVNLWERRVAQSGEGDNNNNNSSGGGALHLPRLRREMRRLMTQDRATSPLTYRSSALGGGEEDGVRWHAGRRVQDSSTLTDSPSVSQHKQQQQQSVASGSAGSRVGCDSATPTLFIDDEIGDQPALGVTKMSPIEGATPAGRLWHQKLRDRTVCIDFVADGVNQTVLLDNVTPGHGVSQRLLSGDVTQGHGVSQQRSSGDVTPGHGVSQQRSSGDVTPGHGAISDQSVSCSGYATMSHQTMDSTTGPVHTQPVDHACLTDTESAQALSPLTVSSKRDSFISTSADNDMLDFMCDSNEDTASNTTSIYHTDEENSQMSGSWSQNIPSRHAYHIHHPFEQQQLPKPRVYRSRTCSSDTTGSLRNSSGVLKPPRRWSGQDEGEWMPVDRDTFMYTTQDFTRVKTMLHKLYRLLQADGSVNPFEQNLNSPCRLSSLSEDSPFSSLDYKRHSASDHSAELARENAELRRQLIVAQRELDEKNSTIRQLQKQLLKLSETQPPSSDISHNL